MTSEALDTARDTDELLPASSEFFPAGENWMPFGSNASSALQTQHVEQKVSASQLADSLLAQLGHLPSQLNSNGNLVAVTGQSAGQLSKATVPDLQLSQNRRPSASEQYHFVRTSSEHAAAAQHLRTSGCFSMQFLEPPNSQATSGQLMHPMLPAHASGARVSGAASEKSHASLASMPHDSSLIRAGGPMINSNGLITGISIASLTDQQQPQSPTQQLFAAHLANAAQQQQEQQQQRSASPSRQPSQLGNSSKCVSAAGSQRAEATAAAGSVAVSAAGCAAGYASQAGAAAPSAPQPSSGDEAASLSVQLSVVQAELAGSQQQVVELSQHLAAAEAARAALQEQLEHLDVKARSQESQLVFAHQQLEMRLQESQAQAAALDAAQHNTAQLQETLASVTDELHKTRQEVDAVSAQQAGDASDARRLAAEVDRLNQRIGSLGAELDSTQQQLADARDQVSAMQRLQSSNGRRMVELEGDASNLAQQLTAAKERAALLEAQNSRMNSELSAAEAAHNKLTQQLAAADLQNGKLSQQLAGQEAAQSRFNQQISSADAHNAKLMQQLSAAEGEVSALRSEVSLLQTSRQQLDMNCEQMRQLQQDQQRHLAQLQNEVSQATQEIMTLRSQNDTLAQRLNAADSSNSALQSGLDKSWQSARAADRAAQETKQQLMQAQQTILQLRQQLQQQGASAASLGLLGPVAGYGGMAAGGFSGGALPGSSMWMEPRPADSYSLGMGPPVSSGLVMESSRQRLDMGGGAVGGGSMHASQEWQGSARSLGASVDAVPWNSGQQQGAYGSTRNSPEKGPSAAAQPAAVSRSCEGTPWFAGGGGRVGSTQQISSHNYACSSAAMAAPAAAAGGGAPYDSQQHSSGMPLGAANTAQQPSSSHPLQMQADMFRAKAPSPMQAAADLGFTGSTLPLSRDMMSVVEIMASTKQLEDQLLDLSKERDELEKELAKMPPGAGRTIKGRQRKMAVESRLDDLGFEISRIRTEIKKLNGQIKR